MSDTQIELVSGETLADYRPLVRSITKSRHQAIAANTIGAFLKEVSSVLDSSLAPKQKERVTKLLEGFHDVFKESLGHMTVFSHKIDTENSPPIKQLPRRLSYTHREEAQWQIKDMLHQGLFGLARVLGRVR